MAMLCREIVTSFVVDFRALVKMLVAKFWSNEERCNPRWSICKESTTLLAPQSNKRIISGDDSRCHV
jgi:histone acetyltransferase MCC1